MDGIPLWSQGMAKAGGDADQAGDGSEVLVRKRLIVPEGHNSIEVHISSEPHNIDVRGAIEGDFRAEVARRLEVSLAPDGSGVRLSWSY